MAEFFASTVLYGAQPFGRACAELAGLGLRRVDLWHIPGWCEHLAEGESAVAATLARYGLQLEALTAYNQPLAQVGAYLPLVARLGAHCVVTGSPGPDVTVEAFARELAPWVEEAERLGVVLAIENHGDAVIDSLASMVELTQRLPSPALGIALAPIHLYNRGESTVEAIRQLRERIALFYVWDWGPSAQKNWKDPTEQFIGTGKIHYPPIFAALREIGYPRPLCLFAHGPEHWPPERATRALADALDVARRLSA